MIANRSADRIGERVINEARRGLGNRPRDRKARREREERTRTLFQVFKAAWRVIVWTIAGIYLLKAFHIDITPLIASAGVLGLAFAFGAQTLIRDFFSGFFILLENQYNLGDMVQIQGIRGTIERITLRLTIIRDLEGALHFIPNGEVTLVSNLTKEWSQARVDIGVSYNEAPQRVIGLLDEIGKALCEDPDVGDELLFSKVLGIESFDDSAVTYRVHLRVQAGSQFQVARVYRQRVMERFMREGVEIPFPQIVLHRAEENPPAHYDEQVTAPLSTSEPEQARSESATQRRARSPHPEKPPKKGARRKRSK